MKIRRINTVILIVLLVFLLANVSQASTRFLNVNLNGERMQVREVPILLNGKIVKSESPSFLYVDRTLVSARLIAENYGAKVTWSHPKQTASIDHNGDKIELKINSNKARVNGREVALDTYSIPRLVDFGSGQAKTMVPLTFIADVLGYDTDWNEDEKAAYLVKRQEEDWVKEEPQVDTSNHNRVTAIDLDGNNIVVKGSKNVKYNTMKLTGPNRLVVDLMDSVLVGSDYLEKTVNMGHIKGVRVSQFVPDKNYRPDDKIVRVVIDMAAGATADGAKLVESGNNLYISSQNIPTSTNNNGSSGGSNWVDQPEGATDNNLVSKTNIGYNNTANIISIATEEVVDYQLDYNKSAHTLSISGPSETLILSPAKKDILGELLVDYQIKNSGARTQIDFNFRRDINYNLLSSSRTKQLEVKIDKASTISKGERIIVLDPGHGGGDPGTSSASGIREKDVALKVGLKLRDRLVAAGYGQVLMTRETDKALVLKDRPKFANDKRADILVSIHANSAGSKSSGVTGIETLYAPNSKNYAKAKQQTELARIIQEELIKETKANDRKIKERPNLVVLRDSKMSSVLLELGFLSNPGEANLLNSDSYQERLADAIFRGVERYLSIYN